MKKFLTITLITFIFAAIAEGQTKTSRSSRDEAEIKRLEKQGYEARMRGDNKAIASLMAPDYTRVYPDGTMRTKQQVLEAVNDPSPTNRLESFTVLEDRVRMYGSWALHTTLGERKYAGQSAKKTRYTSVWVKRGGRWQLLHTHSSDVN